MFRSIPNPRQNGKETPRGSAGDRGAKVYVAGSSLEISAHVVKELFAKFQNVSATPAIIAAVGRSVPRAEAELTGTPLSTIRSAIARGEITTHHLAGGTVVVSVVDVREWMNTERKPGPRPKPTLIRAANGKLYLKTS